MISTPIIRSMDTARIRSLTLLLGMALLATGCGESPLAPSRTPEGVVFKVSPTEYSFSAGDTVRLWLANLSDVSLRSGSLCHARLERLEGLRWTEVRRHPENLVCTLEAIILDPGESRLERNPIRETMTPGLYRFRYRVSIPSGARGGPRIYSNQFLIVE